MCASRISISEGFKTILISNVFIRIVNKGPFAFVFPITFHILPIRSPWLFNILFRLHWFGLTDLRRFGMPLFLVLRFTPMPHLLTAFKINWLPFKFYRLDSLFPCIVFDDDAFFLFLCNINLYQDPNIRHSQFIHSALIRK